MAKEPPTNGVTKARVFNAEGQRVAFVGCRLCGAAILLDPADGEFDPVALHSDYHRGQAVRASTGGVLG